MLNILKSFKETTENIIDVAPKTVGIGLVAAFGSFMSNDAMAQRMTRAEYYQRETQATQNKLMTVPRYKPVDNTGNCPQGQVVQPEQTSGPKTKQRHKDKQRQRKNHNRSVNHVTFRM